MLRTLSEITEPLERKRLLADVEKILVTTSGKTFATKEEISAFYDKWVRLYEERYADLFWLESEGRGPDIRTVGYLTGCADSQKAAPLILPKIRYYELFADQFEAFPAHLHINVAPGNQGKGIGRRLIEAFAEKLGKEKVSGMHLLTSPTANNIQFYRALDFRHEIERKYLEIPLLFMGRSL